MPQFSRYLWTRFRKRSSVQRRVWLAGLVATLLLAVPAFGQINPLRDSSRLAVTKQEEPAGFSDPMVEPAELQVFGEPYEIGLSQVGHSGHNHPHDAFPVSNRRISRWDPEASVIVEGESVEVLPGGALGRGELIEGALLEHGEDCFGCANGCLIPCPGRWLERVEMYGGVHGTTGPANRGGMGSFGFHEGTNWGAPVGCLPWEMGAQIGSRWTQSNFSGAGFSPEDRIQLFMTGGLFRRADWGLQGGLVIDYLRDTWYFENELVQVRGEISWLNPCAHEVGFWFTSNIRDSVSLSNTTDVTPVDEEWETTDLYAFFYRRGFEDCGAEGRIFVGFSGVSDALIGADANVPLGERWALRTGFTYLIPEESSPGAGFLEESWNVTTGFVFYPGCRTSRNKDYNRPLFNVADNGSMLIDRK